MRTYQCQCGNPLFFDNNLCLACQREVGFCQTCHRVVTLLPLADGKYRCGGEGCGVTLVKCQNYSQHDVCNRCIEIGSEGEAGLCGCCRFNQTIPDLTVQGNLQKWYRLEAAKRRLFYDLDLLGLPYGTKADGIEPCLAFEFMADAVQPNEQWRDMDNSQQVYTGHDSGRITINIREADDVEREKARVDLGEKKRTLVGHFRHEIGHFYWDVLIKGRREKEFIDQFGDHNSPPYAEALQAHYQNGPPADWADHYISAYASMHPWEDFAETWAGYLSMVSVLDTAHHMGLGQAIDAFHVDLPTIVNRYLRLGIAMNEMNRSMGLSDAAPEVLGPEVIEKLTFIHKLMQVGRSENGMLQAKAAVA
jgi:hypothetical protein